MRLIIEGPDGSGKSTLAKILSEKYGMTIFHSGGQKELKNVDKYIEADEAWVKIKEIVQNQYALVELIESMMEGIKQRGFAIKHAIEYKKFEAGL